MNVGSAAAGYGFEYVVSTMQRVRPPLWDRTTIPADADYYSCSFRGMGRKRGGSLRSDMPEWGDAEKRGVDMEIETAAAVLAAGSNALS